ncbi:hypothetical protein POM88_042377 [Heracleum sosnowskyi]|uniref:MORF/ORRM1/DAG-like MORF domain-containing protein n=1 Tax=Heracleum sosnowskyi TaxID=360622 RepID=A0AAD8HGP1_9APIA|nr:hypothetical protein POM88_042377 [Heracleum sosnowskyi]
MAGLLLKSLFGLLRLRRPHTRRYRFRRPHTRRYRFRRPHTPRYYVERPQTPLYYHENDRFASSYLPIDLPSHLRQDTLDQEQDDGNDNNHWLIQVKEPVGSRDEIVDCYVKLVAQILGSEDEAKKNIYSVSTKYYFAIGVLASEDVAYKFFQLPEVIYVIQDSYVDRATKDYGGEPFVDGKPVPYDPKHHDFYFRVQARIKARESREAGMI